MTNLRSATPHVLSIIIILLINFLYFAPQFSGKVVQQGDIVQVRKMAKEINDFNASNEEPTLWTNSMFGGMPAYHINTPTNGNKLFYIDQILSLGLKQPAGIFIMGMLFFYLSMILLGFSPWLSLIGTLLFGFSTNNLILYEAGHTGKVKVIMTIAPIIAGLILTFRNQWFKGGLLFTTALGLNIAFNHIQMSYYLAICLIPLVLIYFISAIRKGDLVNFSKSSAVLIIGAILALGASTSRMWTTYEYANETMRGKPILEKSKDNVVTSSSVDGLEYEYAMRWSNGVGDALAAFIPRVVGGGSVELVEKSSPFGKAIGAKKEVQAPTYFGSLPFTSGPIYFGALAFFLCFFGAFAVRDNFKWWLVTAILLTLMLSLGKNFAVFNDLFFNYFPMFNKFRTPNSILSVTAVFIPILAVLAINEVVEREDKKTLLKSLFLSGGILAGICILIWLMGSMFFEYSSPNDERYGKEIAEVLVEQRQSMQASSALRSLFYILMGAGIIWAFIKSYINKTVLIVSLAIFGLLDIVLVDLNYFNHDNFLTERNFKQNFEPREVDSQILQDKDPNFRVYDATIETFNSSDASYFHKTIGGYHAAKLQRFQDIIDFHISKNNMKVLDMLNTKYFIVPAGENKQSVQQNPNALGNAWLVDSIKIVTNANAEIDSLTNFIPSYTAVVHQEYKDYIGNFDPKKEGAIQMTSYAPNKLVYKFESPSEQFAVFSEIWYGPNKGWQAYVDGKEVEHIRVNYLLRGLKVPSGSHEIIFEFKPKSYFLGETISMIVSLSIILLIIGFIIWKYKKKEG